MIKHLPLPAFINDSKDTTLIEEAEAHLALLKKQLLAQHFLDFFKVFPDVKNFTLSLDYESNDEGGMNMYVGVGEIEFVKSYELEKENELRESLFDYINHPYTQDIEDDDFLYKLTTNKITPKNIEKQIEKAFGKKSFQAWQEAKLAFNEKTQLEESLDTKSTKKKVKV